MGPATQLTKGKVKKILKMVKYEICAHTPTSGSACGEARIMFGTHIVVTPVQPSTVFDGFGDSGALVLTTGSCPQPVGMVVGGNSTSTFVAPLAATGSIPGVLQALQTAAGSSSSFVVVPGGGGCTATGQAEVVLGDGSIEAVDATVPDSDVLKALNALPDFLNTGLLPIFLTYGMVDGVAIDFSTTPASFDVTADDGTIQGESDATYVQSLVPTSFDGVPVEV